MRKTTDKQPRVLGLSSWAPSASQEDSEGSHGHTLWSSGVTSLPSGTGGRPSNSELQAWRPGTFPPIRLHGRTREQ
jgi:hypothetical protein